MKKLFNIIAGAALLVPAMAWAETDVLNNNSLKEGGYTETNYQVFTVTGNPSGAEYYLQCAGDGGTIQMRSNNNNSGVVSTVSGGTVKKVTITVNTTKTTYTRTVNIYGSNEPYENAAALYQNTANKVGSVTFDVNGEETVFVYTFEDDYKYIGLRSNSGAVYLAEIAIEWAGEEVPETPAVEGLAQTGYSLTMEYEVPNIAPAATQNNQRSGVGIHDKFFVNEHATGIKVYNKNGELETTIAPTAGYKNWVSCNVDAAGHLLAQIDVKTFDGMCSANGAHGFMIIDTETNEVLQDFVQVGGSSEQRYDAMAPVMKNIMTDYNTRIISVLNGGVNAYQQSYNQTAGTEAVYWKVAAFASTSGLDQFVAEKESSTKPTSTGYAVEYMPLGATASNLAMYANPYYTVTYSLDGFFGNGILNYTGNWTPSGKYFYTPMHSGLTGFNIFTLGEKQYIVYPARDPEFVADQYKAQSDNRPADAFAIAEVSFVDSPATDMTMEGETLEAGLPAGTLVALFPGDENSAVGATSCTPSYTIEAVEGDENSVYIYVFNSGAPGRKWKFTTNTGTGVSAVEAEATDAPVEYFNLQGVRVANPGNGIFIKKQGAKVSKVIL